jgi:hypothetical protein
MAIRPFVPPFRAVMVVPTGVGARIGGFAGDASLPLKLIASVCDGVVTHPNVANAAGLFNLPPNALYVEGYALDRFMTGQWALRPVRAQRVGVLVDTGASEAQKTMVLNTVNALGVVHGVDVVAMIETDEPVQLTLTHDASGASSGVLENPNTLLKGAQTLLAKGATAVAVCVVLPDVEDDAYATGTGVDPIGGLEALISHTLVAACQVPCAHAPLLTYDLNVPVSPRAAAEYITPTFLPCVLQGLAHAPDFVTQSPEPDDWQVTGIGAVVAPANALGGVPVLSAIARGIPVIAVAENTTVMAVTPDHFPQEALIYKASSYLEATGMLQSIRLGIPLKQLYQLLS